jgi:hypothetical protein
VGLSVALAGTLVLFALRATSSGSAPGVPIRATELGWVLVGAAIGAGGVVSSVFVSRRLRRLRPALAADATRVLLGVGNRGLLTQSLAIDVGKLVAQCRSIEQRILGQTLALAVDELHHAKPGDMIALLPSVVTIATKVSERLTPWYVRYEKVVAFFVALLGLMTGLVTAVRALL